MVVAPLIRKLDKIHGLTAEEQQALEKLLATLRDFSPGEDIVREDDKPTMVFGWAIGHTAESEPY